ncbi:hypothetical protein EDB80DRAFT_881358 [Ilyonectria destructans]|nr:hypothetical protein EDB80DRAFT_881358 [Ilyonectria destructans]
MGCVVEDPRNDEMYDKDGNYTLCDPILGNALLPLARLNVANGFQRLYADPWGGDNRKHYEEPALTEVNFAVDVYRAVFVETSRSVVLSRVFGRGDWALTRDGDKVAWGDSAEILGPDSHPGIEQDNETLCIDVVNTEVASFILK